MKTSFFLSTAHYPQSSSHTLGTTALAQSQVDLRKAKHSKLWKSVEVGNSLIDVVKHQLFLLLPGQLLTIVVF